MEAEHDFGEALAIDAEAIGPPGQRRFRLLARSLSQSAAIWLEKQQLAAIGEWLAAELARLDRERPGEEVVAEPPAFSLSFDLDFRAQQIGLGFIEDSDLFTIQAYAADQPGAVARPSLSCRFNRAQARVLARTIGTVVAAGRPLCPLCGQPMEPEGHACPRANGHNLH